MTPPVPARITAARPFVAELLGTFALVFVGGAVLLQVRNVDAGVGLLEVALAHGVILGAMISALWSVSAHLNPAVTLALLATGHCAPERAVHCLGAQFGGGVLATLVLRAVFPDALWEAARGTRPLISLDVSTAQAFTIEAVATGVVMLVVLGTLVHPRRQTSGGMAVGLTYAAALLAITPLTGGSMNPARTLGAMLVARAYEGIALYLTAPVVGAVVAALLYTRQFMDPPRAAAAGRDDDVPQRDEDAGRRVTDGVE